MITAAAPTMRYSRLAVTIHYEYRPPPRPTVRHGEPARVGAEQSVQLLCRPASEAGQQDVRHSLTLQVGAMIGRSRVDLLGAAVPVEIEGDGGLVGVQPDQRLIVSREHAPGREGQHPRQQ